MEAKEYQEKVHSFADYPVPVINDDKEFVKLAWDYPVHGLAEEAGEVEGKFAKILRDKKGRYTEEDVKAICKELGDCLWMIAETCTCIGLELQDVMQANIDKLEDRRARNVIHGSGDER